MTGSSTCTVMRSPWSLRLLSVQMGVGQRHIFAKPAGVYRWWFWDGQGVSQEGKRPDLNKYIHCGSI